MEEILARASKTTEEAEVFMVTSEEMPVEFETNRLKNIQSKQNSTVALRVIKNGRIGYATSTRLDDIEDLISNALATAEFGTEARFTLPSLTPYPDIKVFDPDIETVTLEQMAGLGQGMIDTLTRHTPELICEARVVRIITDVSIINSHGGRAGYKQSVFITAIEGQLIRDTDMLFVGEHQSSCHPLLDVDDITGKVLQQLEWARENAAVPTKSMPVVFTPHGIVSAFAGPLIAAFNGKTVLEGASPIGKKLGQMVFDKRLSLRDDPTIDYRPGSGPCDDEAVPSEVTPLIAEGKVSSFLYDLQTAAMAGTWSTGNGHRSQGGQPGPAPSAFVVTPGDTSFEDMVHDIKEGLVVEQLMGATQGNVLGGDFSGNVLLGYKVEGGKIVGRVKDTMVSGNIYQLLKQVAAIGSDSRWIGGFLSTPSIYCPSVSVASK
jgi:PmbA protein